MMEQELIRAIFNAGTGAIISIILLYGIYRFANKFIFEFINVQQQQVDAINRLTDSLERSMEKDQTEHREMIILLKVITEKLERIENGH